MINDLFLVQEVKEYKNFDECLAYVEDFMVKQGPFDGLMGFSQVPPSTLHDSMPDYKAT